MFLSKKLTLARNTRRGLAVLLMVIFSGVIGISSTVHAGIVCQQMTEVAQETPQIRELVLSGEQVVWRTKKTIRRYDIASQTIHTVAEGLKSKYPYFVEVDGDHIIWTDKVNRVYLHTISTGDTIKISRGEVPEIQPLLDDGYVLYARTQKNSGHYGPFRLMLYDIATGVTRRISNAAFEGWDIDEGRVVYTDGEQIFLYDIASNLSEIIVTGKGSLPHIDGQRVVYIERILKSNASTTWSSIEVFLYDLTSQTSTQITDAGFRVFIHGAWIDGDTVIWGQTAGLSDESYAYFYDIPTMTVSGGIDNVTDFYPDGSSLEIDGRFIGAYDYAYDPVLGDDLSWAAVYDRQSSAILRLEAEGYNAGWNTQLANGRVAWIAESLDDDDVMTENAIYLSANCAVSPNIRTQSKSGNVLSGRPKTLTIEATGDQPISYQWYLGETGDTSLPVGTNSPTYTTPDITTLVSYWARMTNPNGSTDSDTITLSPAPSYQVVRNEGFENPLNKTGGFWNDFWIDRDFPKTQRMCNTSIKLISFEGECAYRFGRPGKYATRNFHLIDQGLVLPQLEAGDVLTVTAYVNSINADENPFVALEVSYHDQPDSTLTLQGDPDAVGYTLMTGTLTITREDIWYSELTIGYPGKKGHVFFDAVTIVASAGETTPLPLLLPEVPGDLRRIMP